MTSSNVSSGVTHIGASNGVTRRSPSPESLADVLERVLDKGVVIVGDIAVSLLDIELLTLKIRLFIASADTASKMGLDWWKTDPYYSTEARRLEDRRRALEDEDDSGGGGR